jgi:hypothetical protein
MCVRVCVCRPTFNSPKQLRFLVPMVMSMMMVVFWDVVLFSLVDTDPMFQKSLLPS